VNSKTPISSLVRWADVSSLGFRSTGVFEPPSKRATGFYWKKKHNLVFFTTPEGLAGVFRLSAAHSREFDADGLSLVPPGCCSVSGRKAREFSPGRDSFPIPKDKFLRDAK
jgi:hypothetical protein